METLGVWLRQAREARGSTLKEAEAATRIKTRFLEMLEAGNFAALPGGDVQARGFLRIYARYLQLSADEVLARYDVEVHGAEAAVPPDGVALAETTASPAAAPAPPPQGFSIFVAERRGGTLQTLTIAGAVVIALAVIVAMTWRLMSQGTGARTPMTMAAPETPGATLASAAVETPTLPVASPTLPPDSSGGVTLALEATEHVWVHVQADGQTVFVGLMSPEQVQTWSAQEIVVVETGNGAGLFVTVNGQLQGRIGARGRICSRAWGPGGEIDVPSPTPSPAS